MVRRVSALVHYVLHEILNVKAPFITAHKSLEFFWGKKLQPFCRDKALEPLHQGVIAHPALLIELVVGSQKYVL
jgi:hypothetical protein